MSNATGLFGKMYIYWIGQKSFGIKKNIMKAMVPASAAITELPIMIMMNHLESLSPFVQSII